MKNIHHRWFISINMLHHNLGLIGVIDCQTGFKLSSYWVNLGSKMLQLGSDSVQRRSMKSMLLMGQKWVALGLIGVIKCQTGFKLSSYWVKHVLYSVQSGSMMYYFYGKIHNYTVYKFVNWSFLAGTYLHTHILPVYHFVLDFLICCPRRGQSELETEDRKKGQGHSGSRSILLHSIS